MSVLQDARPTPGDRTRLAQWIRGEGVARPAAARFVPVVCGVFLSR